ncbi:CHAP domain-containing protein [Actinoallomurus sp. NBC_01490]|jgi:hypothetical protein|uniref:CHAP domain-containing protein n=1 Tax=Actinoallomurus sp. NBC_01490 TaxID=2903557 RepID=UPI002E321FEC|nr:CHAP domain-containing protein [Actinoallomurus sp. NBC_01490]
MIDILDICEGMVGTREAADGTTTPGRWLDAQAPATHDYANADWCASSVLYAIAKVPGGLDAIGGLHKSDAYVQSMHNRLRALGIVDDRPAERAIVFFNWAGTGVEDNHVGIVKKREGRTLWVYEGNHDNKYELVRRSLDSQVTGFAHWWPRVVDDDVAMVVSVGVNG